MAGAKSSGSTSISAIRIRENQRRSRARRKEYVESMERRVQEYERRGVEATLEMQQAARMVAVENGRLRQMLAHMGASAADVDAFLQAFQDRDAAHTLSCVRLQPGCETVGPEDQSDAFAPQPCWTAFDKLDVLAAASLQQGCAESPSTAEPSPGVVTPSPKGQPLASPGTCSPLSLSCDAAAQIITEMQSYGAGGRLSKDELARGDCLVNDAFLFQVLERSSRF